MGGAVLFERRAFKVSFSTPGFVAWVSVWVVRLVWGRGLRLRAWVPVLDRAGVSGSFGTGSFGAGRRFGLQGWVW